MTIAPGTVLNNRYRIVRLLGQGGFGAVYRAWDMNLNGPCALKENFDTSPAAQAQMLERTGAPLPEAQALAWIGQVCEALEYLHEQTPPVIHRDLKPANIRITSKAQAVLVDFGIAKTYDPNLRTTLGARAVTPGYSPNEQYLSQGRTDARSDIYSLGATLFTLLTCQTPPEAPERNMGVGLPAARALNPVVSAHLEAALIKAMELAPDARFQSAAEFRKALSFQPAAFSAQPSTASGGVQPAVSRVQPPAVQVRVPPASPPSAVRSPQFAIPWKWIGVLGGVILAGLVLWGIFGGGGGEREDSAAATMTALAEMLEHLTETARPTRTRPVTDTPGPSATPRPTDTPLPSETPPPTDTPSGFPGMVLIPAGEFQMGSENGDSDEKPVHTVYLDAYYIDVYEVTNALFEEFVQATGHETTAEVEGGGYAYVGGSWDYVEGADWQHPQGPGSNLDSLAQHPVVLVSWDDAAVYCEWRGGSLPTEAQWEKAARGGQEGKAYPWGDDGPVCQKGAPNGAKFDDNAGCNDTGTEPVGSYSANDYGLFDMAGNVWEWVLDWYEENYYNSQSSWRNPFGPASGQYRVLRGGSWSDNVNSLRAAYRNWSGPANRNNDLGFRCSRSP